MNDISDLYGTTVEPDDESLELGYLGALFDGILTSFEARGVIVSEEDGWLVIRHPVTGHQMGGKLHLRNETVASAHDWLVAKADRYGRTDP